MTRIFGKANTVGYRLRKTLLAGAAGALALGSAACTAQTAETGMQKSAAAPMMATTLDGLPSKADVLAKGQKVADWQRVRLDEFPYVRTFLHDTEDPLGWVQASLFIGMTHWADHTGDDAAAAAVASEISRNNFELGSELRHADYYTIGQSYMWLYEKTKDPAVIAPSQARLDLILADEPTNSLEFIPASRTRWEGTCQERWCWADALFMAPRLWQQMANATGNQAYSVYADKEFWAATDYMYDDELHLFYRDSRYFDAKSPNGKPVFWSRGNGWVFGGLALLLEDMPKDHPNRARYVTLFEEMARAMKPLQRENGYWPASLMDPDAVTTPETSGTAFITFGLAWGLNHGYLSADEFGGTVTNGWNAIADAVAADGKVEWVQQVGKAPEPVLKSDTQLYGVGAVLLAAAEVAELAK